MAFAAEAAPVSTTATRPFAAPDIAAQSGAPGLGGLGQTLFALALVLFAIFACAWVVRKLRGSQRGSGTALRVVAEVALGQKERAVILQAGNSRLLVGVATGSVNLLQVLPDSVPGNDAGSGDDAAPSRPNFADLLRRSLGK